VSCAVTVLKVYCITQLTRISIRLGTECCEDVFDAINSQLKIAAVRDEYAGFYFCMATNGYSSDNSSEAFLGILPRM
jgi:hypothetical protein